MYIGHIGLNISFTARKPNPVYAIDKKGNYQRFNSQKEAAKNFNISEQMISQTARNFHPTAKGYVFIRAEEIEKADANGNITVNTQEIGEKLSKIDSSKFYARVIPVYAVDTNGTYQKFANQKEAEKSLGISQPRISNVIAGEYGYKTAGGYVFAYAEDVENKDNKGNVSVDLNKIKELTDKAKSYDKTIYAIDKKGNYRKFKNETEAAKAFNIKSSQISVVLTGNKGSKTANGHTFVRARDIEIEDANGNTTIDLNKIKELTDKANFVNKKALYAIDSKGNYQKFSSQSEAAKALNISETAVHIAARRLAKTAKGYILVPAGKIETKDENGVSILDTNKLTEILKKHNK